MLVRRPALASLGDIMSVQKLPVAASQLGIVPEMTRERRAKSGALPPSQKAYRCAHQKILMRQRLCVILSRVP